MPPTFGPVELVVLGFEGNRFSGSVAPAIIDLVDRGIVRIIDLAVVTKDDDGSVIILEMQELSVEVAAAMQSLHGDVSGLLSEADLLALAEDLAPNSTVAVIMFEHVWATDFAVSVRDAGGELILSQRIPNDLVEATRESLIAAAAAV